MFKPFFRRKQNTLESKEELNGDTNNIPKARENADDLVVISIRLHLIGLKSGASFLDQSLSEVKQNQFNLRYIYEAQLTIFSAVFWESFNYIVPILDCFWNRKNSLQYFFATYFDSMVGQQ